jgi:hypothetical protein
VVVRLLDQSREKLKYLEEKGLKPGTLVTVVKRETVDGLTHIIVEGAPHVLSESITQSVLLAEPLPHR